MRGDDKFGIRPDGSRLLNNGKQKRPAPDNANEGELRTELVGYDEIGSAIRKVKDEPLYTIKQARELVVAEIMGCEDLWLYVWKNKWLSVKELSADEVIKLINK